MKLTLIATIAAVVLSSCAGLTGSVSTPWGDIATDNGKTVVTPKPIIIPEK